MSDVDQRAVDRLRERELAAGMPAEKLTDEHLRNHPHFAYVRLGVARDDLVAAVRRRLPGALGGRS